MFQHIYLETSDRARTRLDVCQAMGDKKQGTVKSLVC